MHEISMTKDCDFETAEFKSFRQEASREGRTQPKGQTEPEYVWDPRVEDCPQECQRVLETYKHAIDEYREYRKIAAEMRYQIRLRAYDSLDVMEKLKDRLLNTEERCKAYNKQLEVHKMVENRPFGFDEGTEDLVEVYNALCERYRDDKLKIEKGNAAISISGKHSNELTDFCRTLESRESKLYKKAKRIEARLLAGDIVTFSEAYTKEIEIPTIAMGHDERKISDFLDTPQQEMYKAVKVPDLKELCKNKQRHYSLVPCHGGIGYKMLFHRPEWPYIPRHWLKMIERRDRKSGAKKHTWIDDVKGFIERCQKKGFMNVVLSTCIPMKEEVESLAERRERLLEKYPVTEADYEYACSRNKNLYSYQRCKAQAEEEAARQGTRVDSSEVLRKWTRTEYAKRIRGEAEDDGIEEPRYLDDHDEISLATAGFPDQPPTIQEIIESTGKVHPGMKQVTVKDVPWKLRPGECPKAKYDYVEEEEDEIERMLREHYFKSTRPNPPQVLVC